MRNIEMKMKTKRNMLFSDIEIEDNKNKRSADPCWKKSHETGNFDSAHSVQVSFHQANPLF